MDENEKSKVRFMLQQQDYAFKTCPTGSFWERWIRGMCKHSSIRCTHGDEIIGRNGKRRVCLVCGRGLKGDLPEFCFFTGEFHDNRPNGAPT